MNFELTPRQKEIQAEARHFAQTRVAPLARQMDETGQFEMGLIPEMGQLGFLTGPVSPDYGGGGLDYVSFATVYEELGQACSSTRGFLAVHAGLVSMCVSDWGVEAQKRKYLPRLSTGELVGCYCLTEENAGSDVAGMEATAVKVDGGWRLDGQKIWITNGNIAGLALVFASMDRALRHRGICAFLVETDNPGFKRAPMPGVELGHRASDHARIILEDCFVPDEALLGEPGQGFKIAMSALDHGRLGVAAGALGVAQACLDACVDFAQKRQQFGQRIGDFQMIQSVIADMTADVEAARLLVYRAAWAKDRAQPGQRTSRETSIAKLFATEVAVKAASEAVLLHGGRGYSSEYPVERYYRDIKGLQIYEGTSHIQRIVIAREVLGR
ncbi:MAG: acyl-CoA dehydrogenase family protein [Anaerolineae bacterium]